MKVQPVNLLMVKLSVTKKHSCIRLIRRVQERFCLEIKQVYQDLVCFPDQNLT